MKTLQTIDELYLTEHHHLTSDDECYYLTTYTSGAGYEYSDDNDLMSNFKKDVNRKGKSEWKYKEDAIKEYARMLQEVNLTEVFGNDITIVPVPPSKVKTDVLYDDRLNQVLQLAFDDGSIDIKELVLQQSSTESSHSSEKRLSIEALKDNYYIDETLCADIKSTILIVFDDMITAGAHYKAMKEILEDRFPDKKIIFLGLARRSTVYKQ